MYYGDDDDIAGVRRFKFEMKGSNELIIIGINPSTARGVSKNCTECTEDMTIKRVLGFSNRNWNYDENKIRFDGFLMLNVCAQVATAPKDLNPKRDEEMHKLNLSKIKEYLKVLEGKQDIYVLLAYGNAIKNRNYLKDNLGNIRRVLKEHNAIFFRLGKLTAKGNPCHPLYLPGDTLLQTF